MAAPAPELDSAHRDSALLKYCVRALSRDGRDGEIAAAAPVADEFGVFEGALVDSLAQIPGASAEQLDALLPHLARVCGETAFTHLYAGDTPPLARARILRI